MERAEAPSRKGKKRVTDRTLPPDVVGVAPDASLYNELLEAERKLDWTITRKRLDVQEALSKPQKTTKTLRIFVSHTVQDQVWQSIPGEEAKTINFETGEGIPSWTLRLEGRLLEDPSSPRKLSSFLKSLIVDMDRDPRLFPEDNIVEWHNPMDPNLPSEDGFSIRRRGDAYIRVRIILHMVHHPDRFNIGGPLGGTLGVKQGSRQDIINALWNYIKINGLQDKSDRRTIRFDNGLKRIFGVDAMAFQNIPEAVDRFLTSVDPVIIYHNIRVDPEGQGQVAVYDVPVDLDDVDLKSKMRQVLDAYMDAGAQAQINELDEQIASSAQAVRDAKLKREFFDSFAEDPQAFVKNWVASQSRDLETILGTDRNVPEEQMRRSDFFKLPWIEEGIIMHEGMRSLGSLSWQSSQGAAR